MRTVYNLTDRVPPIMAAQKKGRAPKTLLIEGRPLAPGRSVVISDAFRLGTIGSLIATEAVSVDHLPAWYQVAKDDTPREVPEVEAEPEPPKDEEPVEKTGRRKKKRS